MIEIRNNKGELAELSPSTSITIEKTNPLFNDDDKIFEDITYGFKMPLSDVNKVFFANGHLIETENEAYEMQVQTVVAGSTFFAGTIRFTIVDGEFNVLLLVNFGSVTEKVKTIKISEIFFDDAIADAVTPAFMKTVCQNPSNYPFSFFPVYNEKWWSGGVTTHPIINNWNHATQNFVLSPGSDFATVPFFKLKYVLTKVLKYLGFDCAGSFISDPEADKIYIYNPIYSRDFNNSNVYLPYDMLIADFLKQIRERLKIACSFDVFNGAVNVESANSLLKSADFFDLSPYISEILEINTPSINGYTITLKPDNKDAYFKDPGDENKFLPTNKLIIGNGDKAIELEISTLKSKSVEDYTMPMISQQLFLKDNFQLKLLYYNGMKAVAGGKIFPEATPMELNLSDAVWYQFLNDGKPLKLNALVPSYLLAEFVNSKKIGIKSLQGFFASAIFEKISYNLTNDDSEFVNVTVECRTVVFDYKTQVAIVPFAKTEAESAIYDNNLFKAYFEKTGLEQIELQAYYPTGSNGWETYLPLTAPKTDTIIIKKSTDKHRGGGAAVYMPFVNLSTISRRVQELRIYTGIPKYLIIGGFKVDFILHADGYYWCKPYEAYGTNQIQIDFQPIWVVF